MDDALQRLLETEARARALIEAAGEARQHTLDAALASAQQMQQQLEHRSEGLRAPYLHEAEAQAAQITSELARKQVERQQALRELAARHEQEAVQAALGLLLDPAL